MHGRLALAGLIAAATSACYIDGAHSRDEHRTVDQIRQEHRWAADEIGRRMSAEELGRVRAGETDMSRAARRRLGRLLDALDRVTWIREATPRGLWASADDASDQDELAFRFARAAQLRREAISEADEIAEALATSTAPGALGWADLRRAMGAVKKMEASEDRMQAELQEVARKDPSLKPALARFPPLAPPEPRPFVAAATAYLRVHPNERGELDKLPPDLQADAARIRTALTEAGPIDEPAPPGPPPAPGAVKPVPQEPPPDEKAAVRDRAEKAHAEAAAEGDAKLPGEKAKSTPGGLLNVSGDAQKMLSTRGLPKAFGQRPDGTFALRYEEPRPCASGSCNTLVDYLFGAGGALLREEVVGPAANAEAPAAAPPAKPPPPPQEPGDPDD